MTVRLRRCDSIAEEAETDCEFWERFTPVERVAILEQMRREWLARRSVSAGSAEVVVDDVGAVAIARSMNRRRQRAAVVEIDVLLRQRVQRKRCAARRRE